MDNTKRQPSAAIFDYLQRLLAYDRWANRETLKSLRTAEKSSVSTPKKALDRMAHIVATERLWMQRIQQVTTGEVWPKWAVEECVSELKKLESEWEKLSDALDAERLTSVVVYKNSKGERWLSSVQDILQHVVLHSAHHRGQIASDLRSSGHEPAYTDFIHAVRQGFLP